MTASPNEIAALARALIAAKHLPKCWKLAKCPGCDAQADYDEAVRDPATVLALCERLRVISSLSNLEAMNHPLTPEPAGAGGLPSTPP